MSSNIMKILLPTIQIILCASLYIYVNQSLQNLNLDICIEANKSHSEINVIKKLQAELELMFESLQEGIVVIQNEGITFSNIIFDSL